MAEFLTTKAVLYHLENIIRNANKRLVLISPYLQISDTLFQTLKDADKRKVGIVLVYGKEEDLNDARSQLEQLDNLSLRYLKNMHAKCYFNEENMVITSLNLLKSSEDNREMGVLISAKNDEVVFKAALDEATLIIRSSTQVDLRMSKKTSPAPIASDSYRFRTGQQGYCIRCRIPIRCDLSKPLCPNCYEEWGIFENPDYEENFCHTCGRRAPTSIDKPQCHSCYRR